MFFCLPGHTGDVLDVVELSDLQGEGGRGESYMKETVWGTVNENV